MARTHESLDETLRSFIVDLTGSGVERNETSIDGLAGHPGGAL